MKLNMREIMSARKKRIDMKILMDIRRKAHKLDSLDEVATAMHAEIDEAIDTLKAI